MNASPKPAPKRVHIVGISGVATSALAVALHKKGVKVTGSDKGIYPPASTYLDGSGIKYYTGWHPENIEKTGKPEVIIAGGIGTSPSNPEIIYAKEKAIPLISFAEAIGRYIVKKNSIVTSGTWGKTTNSALLSFILIQAGMDPSYFSGGISLSHDTGMLTDSDWSVVEGDEYQTSITDKRPKFAYYSPTHLLLTSVSWDHADLYPTEESYFKTFEGLVAGIPKNGLIVACMDDDGVCKTLDAVRSGSNPTKAKMVSYGLSKTADYSCKDISHTKDGLSFSIVHNNKEYKVGSPMLGRYNAENITGCFAMAYEIGVKPETIIKAVHEFKGIKRRFEKRFEGEITVLDCHAPTPEKAAAALKSVREVYDKKIIALYEPNIGGRQRASAGAYSGAFKDADIVLIPHLTKLKNDKDSAEKPLEGDELAKIISKTHGKTEYIDDDSELVKKAAAGAQKGDVIVFLGSHGWRGMIEEIIQRSKSKERK